MAYRAPGVRVNNVFQPVANPNTGSALVSCVVGQITDNINAFPIASMSATRGIMDATQSVTWAFDPGAITDTFSVTPKSPGLSGTGLTLDNRISSVTYTGINYNASQIKDPSTAFSEVLDVMEFTRGSGGSTDSLASTIAYADVAYCTLLPLDLAISSWASTQAVSVIDQTGALYSSDVDFTYAFSTDGSKIVVDITWNAVAGDIRNPEQDAHYWVVLSKFAAIPIGGSADANQQANIVAANYFVATMLNATTEEVDYKIIWKVTNAGASGSGAYGGTPYGAVFTYTPPPSASYSVSYHTEFPAELKIYTNLSDVMSDWGNPVLADGSINQLAFAAYIFFNENGQYLMLGGFDGLSKYDNDGTVNNMHRTIDETFEDMLMEDGINIVTVLDSTKPLDNSYAIKKLLNHTVMASSADVQKYRLAIAGIDVSSSTNDVQDYIDTAEMLESNRMVLVGPSQVQFSVNVPTQSAPLTVTCGAAYLAVIMAAMWGRPESDPATSMTRKQSYTIAKLAPQYTDAKMNLIASHGVTLFNKYRGNFVVRDDITTYTALLLQSQPYITLVSDNISTSLIDTLDTTTIGLKTVIPTTLNIIQIAISSMLIQKQEAALITTASNPIVSQDTSNPLKINVTVSVVPVFATKLIDITVSYTVNK